jgi:integrase
VAYLNERHGLFGRIDGPLFRAASNRNYGAPLGPSSWSKTVERIACRAGAARLSTHTFRHLRLTDLARADWAIDQIAQYAGHRDLATTMRYIHLSGRELAARLHRAYWWARVFKCRQFWGLGDGAVTVRVRWEAGIACRQGRRSLTARKHGAWWSLL